MASTPENEICVCLEDKNVKTVASCNQLTPAERLRLYICYKFYFVYLFSTKIKCFYFIEESFHVRKRPRNILWLT